MMGFYRTWASIGILLGINIAVKLFNLPVKGNLLLGNHLVEAAAAFAIIIFLVDLNIVDSKIKQSYFKIGLIAFFAGIIMVAASFSSLFVLSSFIDITIAWFKIAPQIIFLIGIPSLYIADRLSQKNQIFGMENIGGRGLFNVFIATTLYSIFAIYILNKYSLLMF